jgi:chloramphenicol-sensitive protein RarD
MDQDKRTGLAAGVAAYLTWGFLPIFWKSLGIVPPDEILAWRIAGSAAVAWVYQAFRRKPLSKSAMHPGVLVRIAVAAMLIGGNWGLFIWAVASERILEASLGYYINPLVNVVLGVMFFSERLGRKRIIAIGLAAAAVIIMTIDAGTFPWVSILLALLFGFYGLTVKGLPSQIDSIEVLAWETAFTGPLFAGYLAYRGFNTGLHFFGFGSTVTFLLILAGPVTLFPLWLFGVGAKRIPLSILGFLQYLAPTLMLLLGVLVYGEPFSPLKGAAFILVAVALMLYTVTLRDS